MFMFRSRLLRFTTFSFLLLLTFFLVMRLGFALAFMPADAAILFTPMVKAASIGIRFDIRLAALSVFPLLLLGGVSMFFKFTLSRALVKQLAKLYVTALFAYFFTVYALDFGYYEYLNDRLDATSLRFLEDFSISANMVWESYPVVWITLAFTLSTWLIWRLTGCLFVKATAAHFPTTRWQKISGGGLAVACTIFLIHNSTTLMPLRWSEAFFSKNSYVVALGLNPVLFFADTLKNRNASYDIKKTKKYYPMLADVLGLESRDPDNMNFRRKALPLAHVGGTPNVVVVMMESMGANRLGLYGNPQNPTPYLDALIKESVYFPYFYVPFIGTARTVFTSITGIPDTENVKTASRNPLTVDQHSIFNDFKGYERYYFIGGSAGWANIRGILQNNIKNLEIFEEGVFTEPNVDVWGISDISLVREFKNKLSNRNRDKPFIAFFQTAGNHKPFTIPDDNEGFETITLTDEQLLAAGFVTNEQFNGVRLADHSIGYLMQELKKVDGFENTIFAFYGDHNHKTAKSQAHNDPMEDLDLMGVHVPFFIYAPKYLKPQVIDSPASLVDVLPTMASLAGLEYVNTTLGRDLFNIDDDKRYAFVQEKNHQYIGVIGNEFYLRTRIDGQDVSLHQWRSADYMNNVAEQFPQKADYLRDLALGYLETSRYVQYHNGAHAN